MTERHNITLCELVKALQESEKEHGNTEVSSVATVIENDGLYFIINTFNTEKGESVEIVRIKREQ